jgi:3-dehydroquinate synthase
VNPTEPDPQPDEPPSATETVHLDLGARSYDIVVGERLLAEAGQRLAPKLESPRAVIITDANVAPLYLAGVARALRDHGVACDEVVLPPGEQTKDFKHLEELLERLLAANPERGTTLVALGGGVIGDIVGFAASILLRGVDYVQLPTTLLAQVDSAVGGKTGINSRHGKNLIGSFHQPRLVLADTGTLDTLSARELRAGYAEVVKYGVIRDAGFFAWLEQHGAALLAGDRDARRHAVVTSCSTKAQIVAQDEREGGVRALLGMALAFRLSSRLGLCPDADCDRVVRHLAAAGLPTGPAELAPRAWRADALLTHMAHDKKVRDGKIRFVLARGIGRAFVTDEVPTEEVRAVLAEPGDAAAGRADRRSRP